MTDTSIVEDVVKFGFNLKTTHGKRSKINATANALGVGEDVNEGETTKETVTEITKGVIKSAVSSSATSNLLIIPLPPTRRSSVPTNVTETDAPVVTVTTTTTTTTDDDTVVHTTKTLEQLAAEELVAESKGEIKHENGRMLTIPSVSNNLATTSQSNNNQSTAKAAPLLMANLAPELLAAKDDEERFKVDISMRPEDLNVRSDAYKAVPIEEFGAAMLRGMGWTGPDESTEATENQRKQLIEDKERMVPRESRLGLGATARPPEEKGRGNKERNAQKKKEWDKKALELLKKQTLTEEDIVWLRDPQYAGRRAVVIAVRGVPGLDRIRVRLESVGTAVEVKRTDAVLLSTEELTKDPFKGVPVDDNSAAGSNNSTKFFGLVDNRSDVAASSSSSSATGDSRKRGRDVTGVADDDHKGKQQRSSHREGSSSSSSGSRAEDRDKGGSKKESTAAFADNGGPTSWLLTGIRVRIISKKVESGPSSSCYLAKGVVLDVPDRGRGTVRLDDGRVVEAIKEKYLETVLPSIGGTCTMLLGAFRGQSATLLEKRKDDGQVVVQLSEDLELVVLSMDHIAAASLPLS